MDATTAVEPVAPVPRPPSPPSTASPVKTPAAPLNAPGPGTSDKPETAPDATGSSRNEPAMSTATATTPTPPAEPQQPTATHGLKMGIQSMFPSGNAAHQALQDAAAVAMTPTTTNYGLNAQLVKSTGTLTPLGEDKISTAGPSGTQKAKQTKKKAAAADGETVKKPTARARAKADPNKAEKRKASPARPNNNQHPTPSNGAAAVAPPMSAVPSQAPPTATVPTSATSDASKQANSQQMGANTSTGQQQELLPSQDTELRKEFLQRIYRQLQMTHRNQDDAMVRRLATNIEIDICRRAATRSDYVTYMNQQINSLMQAELTNGTVGLQSSLYVPGVGMPSSSNGMNTVPTSGGIAQQASTIGYAQNPAAGSRATDIAQQSSASSQGSFMSLLSSQAPVQTYDAARGPQHYGAQGLAPHGRQQQYGVVNTTPGYPAQGHSLPQSASMKTDTQGDLASQQVYAGQRMPAQPSSTTAPAEFAAQFQRLDRNGLLDLLWTQHKTVIQYQRRLAQLEVQLKSRPSPSGGPASSMMPSSGNNLSGYYNASPRQTVPAAVPASVAAEAEAQRARDRATSRAAHPGQYAQPHYPPPQAPATPPGGVNPPLYWEKVRYLSDTYLRHLYVAHHALSQHSAPANSAQGAKAENVKHNISLACQILSENPTNAQPRPLEILDSIERFIQSTVVPIVRKVSPQALTPTASGASGMPSMPHMRPQQTAGDVNDPSRNPMMTQTASLSMPTPTNSTSSTAPNYSNGSNPPVAPPPGIPAPTVKVPTKAAKGGAKTAGKKSPSNGPKKTATPKATVPRANAKAGGKKTPGKAGGAKQAAISKAALPINGGTTDAAGVPPAQTHTPAPTSAAAASENVPKDRSETTPMKTGAVADDDSLNDFSDFADLDFDDDLQDPLMKVSSNKENAAGVNSRKRSIEDV